MDDDCGLEEMAREFEMLAASPGDGSPPQISRRRFQAWAKVLRQGIAEYVACPECNGLGRRWSTFAGERTCSVCRGSGKR